MGIQAVAVSDRAAVLKLFLFQLRFDLEPSYLPSDLADRRSMVHADGIGSVIVTRGNTEIVLSYSGRFVPVWIVLSACFSTIS